MEDQGGPFTSEKVEQLLCLGDQLLQSEWPGGPPTLELVYFVKSPC